MKRNNRIVFFGIICLVLFLPAVHLTSQDQGGMQSRVMVEDTEAKELLSRAKNLEKQGHMKPAAKKYVTLLKSYNHTAVSQKNENNLYVGIAEIIRRRISKWDQDRLEWLSDYVRGDAVSMYEDAKEENNYNLYLRVANVYFFTQAGEKAARKIAQLNFRDGNFSTAAYWWKQILRYHPSPAMESIEYRLRIYSAYRAAGNQKLADTILKRVEKDISSYSGGKKQKYQRLLGRLKKVKADRALPVLGVNRDRPGGNNNQALNPDYSRKRLDSLVLSIGRSRD